MACPLQPEAFVVVAAAAAVEVVGIGRPEVPSADHFSCEGGQACPGLDWKVFDLHLTEKQLQQMSEI